MYPFQSIRTGSFRLSSIGLKILRRSSDGSISIKLSALYRNLALLGIHAPLEIHTFTARLRGQAAYVEIEPHENTLPTSGIHLL